MIPRTPRAACLAVSATLALAGIASAQTGPDLLLKSFDENRNYVGRADLIYGFDGHTDNDDSDVQLSVINASGMMKLDLDSVAKGLSLNRAQPRGGFDFTTLNIRSDDPALPDHFTDVSLGMGLGIGKGEKWVAGVSFAIGHASSNTFGDGNGWYGKADIAIGYTFDEVQSLGIILDYDGNRSVYPDIPLPGFVYKRKITEELNLSLGFPYTDLEWKPDDRWTIALRYVIPDGGEASVEYKLVEAVRLYASFSNQNEAFHSNELEDEDDRVLFSQRRIEVGLRGTYNDQFSFFVAGGYAFGQEFEVGWDRRDTEELAELSDEPYARIGVELNF